MLAMHLKDTLTVCLLMNLLRGLVFGKHSSSKDRNLFPTGVATFIEYGGLNQRTGFALCLFFSVEGGFGLYVRLWS